MCIYIYIDHHINHLKEIAHHILVMSIGNQKFDIPRKYQYQIGIWYFRPKFLGIFLVFHPYFVNDAVKIWFTIGICWQNKNRFGIWFLWLPFRWYRFEEVNLGANSHLEALNAHIPKKNYIFHINFRVAKNHDYTYIQSPTNSE